MGFEKDDFDILADANESGHNICIRRLAMTLIIEELSASQFLG